jgi:hypothetical protein
VPRLEVICAFLVFPLASCPLSLKLLVSISLSLRFAPIVIQDDQSLGRFEVF